MVNKEAFTMTKGPFPTGIPVEGEQLIGREKELKMLSQLLQDGQSVILVSPRRYGKTSLILEVIKRLKKQSYFTADIDLFSIASKRELAAYNSPHNPQHTAHNQTAPYLPHPFCRSFKSPNSA